MLIHLFRAALLGHSLDQTAAFNVSTLTSVSTIALSLSALLVCVWVAELCRPAAYKFITDREQRRQANLTQQLQWLHTTRRRLSARHIPNTDTLQINTLPPTSTGSYVSDD